jgi:predicted nuclease of restriction endonuclease-like (RecB) superfamily
VLALIETARTRAYQAVNSELVTLYWQLGEHISQKIENAEWGDGVVDELAAALARRYSGLRGFARPNLFRMRQFYKAYRGNKKVSALLKQFAVDPTYAHPRPGEAARDTRVLHPRGHPRALVFPRTGTADPVLSLSDDHSEADLHAALLRNLGRFITELGRDFCFVGSEYPVQVGKQDFAIDLVFFHRGLSCLVAFELKVRQFEPEDLGKLSFYVEALDRDVRKEHERPSIGVAALRNQGRRGRRVRACSHHLANARRRVSNNAPTPGAST